MWYASDDAPYPSSSAWIVGPSRDRVLALLEHQHRGPLGRDEAVPITIEGARRVLRVVVARGERAGGGEHRDAR